VSTAAADRPNAEPLIAAHDVVKGYRTAAGYVPVLAGASLDVAPGEMVAIIGASGVGKSRSCTCWAAWTSRRAGA
jgi:ABC-type glutathione transport system ATPase component